MARILVIEDNRTNLDLMLYLLRAFGHEPIGLTDPAAALDTARDGNFDAIVSDILMPGLDGFSLAGAFRAAPELKSTPLIAVTALAMRGDRERILSAGFDGYISKPIDPATFVSQVNAFLPQQRDGDDSRR